MYDGSDGRSPQASSASWMPDLCQPGLVSVIVPAYNRALLVSQTLGSVARQTYRPIEVVIVDDGSTDDTQDVIAAWTASLAGDSGLAIQHLHQKNAGDCVARNAGLQASHGEYVQFLDSDDLLHEERFARVVDVFGTTSCSYVYTGFLGFCGVCGQTLHTHIPRSTARHPFEMICTGDIWGNILQFTVRRSTVARVGPWDTSLAVFQDYDYLVRLLLASDRGVGIPTVLAFARRGRAQRLSDIRTLRVGFECQMHGAVQQRDGLLARDSPLDVRALMVSRFRDTAWRIRPQFPDLAEGFADLGRTLDICGPRATERLDHLYWRSRYAARDAFLHSGSIAKRALLSMVGSERPDHATACPYGPRSGPLTDRRGHAPDGLA
jgi:glycosyltransferase involved in cell wall biosynthesis